MTAHIHPAVWIAAWCLFAALSQRLELFWLVWLAVPVLALVVGYAWRDALRLLKRARWLLLAIAVLFVLATPGARLPGPAGAIGGLSVDGLLLAAEHVLRLTLLLATLALLLGRLGRIGFLAGLHCLLAPAGQHRERLVVRLLLALEYAEGDKSTLRWRDLLAEASASAPALVHLPVARLSTVDIVLLVGALVAAIGVSTL